MGKKKKKTDLERLKHNQTENRVFYSPLYLILKCNYCFLTSHYGVHLDITPPTHTHTFFPSFLPKAETTNKRVDNIHERRTALEETRARKRVREYVATLWAKHLCPQK